MSIGAKMTKGSIPINNAQKLLAICGIVGPVLYTIVLVTLGLLRPGYNHVTQSMSELGELGGPNAIIMNIAGFILLGLMMIAFAFGLHRGIGEGEGSKIGPVLVAVSGVALVITGIFPCDPGCVDVSIVGSTHSVFAVIAAFALTFAPLAIFQTLKKDNRWHSYLAYSLVTTVVALVLSAVYGFNVSEQWKGLLQRISMGVPLLCVEAAAIVIFRLHITSVHSCSI